MKLCPMTMAEYGFWSPRSRTSYAADKRRANGYTEAEAQKIADEDFKRLLPDGLETPDNFLFTAKGDKGELLGFIWFRAQGAPENRKAFVCDVVIEEPHRGRGYGRKIMQLAEAEAKKRGLNRIGLHVFGFNTPAIKLYESLGYMTTDLVMEKPL